MASYESRYGIRETGKPYQLTEAHGTSWLRDDIWRSNDPADERVFVETAHCAGADDDSDVVINLVGYEGSVFEPNKCSFCYLHINHTRKIHDRRCSS